jgi:hypothetical protein
MKNVQLMFDIVLYQKLLFISVVEDLSLSVYQLAADWTTKWSDFLFQ